MNEILSIIWYIIPFPVWIILFAGIIRYVILEIQNTILKVKETNVKNTEKIKDKETL